jgi:hypothetical protein
MIREPLLHAEMLVHFAQKLRVALVKHGLNAVQQLPHLRLYEEAIRAFLLGGVAESVQADQIRAPACKTMQVITTVYYNRKLVGN